LLADRRSLLDLGTRNRLINVPLRTKGIRAIEIVDERATEVFRLLEEGRAFSFVAGRLLTAEEKAELSEDDVETGGIPQPDAEDVDERGVARRHLDTRLQTRLTSEGLQKRLFDIWYDARTLEEEQGVNILYLAFGLLRWYEDDTLETARHAPLVLLPVRLDRTSAADRFTLRSRGEPASHNLSLQAKMNAEFGLKIVDLDDAGSDDVDPSDPSDPSDVSALSGYMAKVAETVSAKARWEVLPDAMVLGFFSFAKFLMYRDLDPENWPVAAPLDKHPIVEALLRDGFEGSEPIVPAGGRIDAAIPPLAMHHVVDADSSQAVVIEEVARGRHLVVKGPPGTGKSQTITNLIAAAATEGKKVLFVAEKMAALDVVHRRLRNAGLGPLALELHSNKANKRAVLEELRQTKDRVGRTAASDVTVVERLTAVRDQLNAHADGMHTAHAPGALTPYQLIGHLIRTRPGQAGFALEGPEQWTPAEFAARAEVCDELVHRLATIPVPAQHPWRGVRRDALDPGELEQLSRQVVQVRADLDIATETARESVALLGIPAVVRVSDLDRLLRLLQAIVALPECDRRTLAGAAWKADASASASASVGAGAGVAAELVRAGRRAVESRDAAAAVFTDAAWPADLGECRTVLATKGRSLFRFFSGQYRAQRALLRSYLRVPLPTSCDEQIAMIDALRAAQDAKLAFDQAKAAGPGLFGTLWHDERSDWNRLQAIVDWRARYADVLSDDVLVRLAESGDLARVATLHRTAEEVLPRFRANLEALARSLDLDLPRAIGAQQIPDVEIAALSATLDGWREHPEAITRWIAFHDRCRAAVDLGLGRLVDGLLDGQLGSGTLIPAFERAYFEAIRTDVFSREPSLKRFDGESHDRLVQTFRALDAARMALAREQIVARHASELPRGNGGIGPLGVLNGELAKKRNHLPIRQLLEKAGPAIQQIKPIFMMSPLSVAQFLKPGAMSFDVLVVDEASQIEPVDALGAVARCRQVVVVGDERQLPPTRFFAKLTSDVDERDEADETFQARDAESILDLCLAKGMSHRMLNWHYRSKHQSLIAVSNREFYDNRLFIVPSPYDAVAGMGLKFHYLPHAHYDRGNTRTNPIEARTVAEAVIRHAQEHPEKTLGVATFSVAQRQVILKELELLRRAHPQTEEFFTRGSSEPFFVKNLENIQGDERDVIFISVGYGKTDSGYMAMSFGPLNAEGGERRLNVLISRAKLRCELFSSITADDIDLDRVRSRGVAALKLFLAFAQTGRLGTAEQTGKAPDSLFEEQVADTIRSLGHDVKTQIGTAGFFVDLAIADPEKPGRFILGIECDGAQYHSSRSARDRDRLREHVLVEHGWIVHRIWSTDWYLRPTEELAKVQAAIEAAKAEWRSRDQDGHDGHHRTTRNEAASASLSLQFAGHREGDTEVLTAEITSEVKPKATSLSISTSTSKSASMSIPYAEATLAVRTDVEPHEAPVADMARYVAQVVAAEGPIHQNEIVTRIRSAWGLARAGNRIRDAVQAGVDAARQASAINGGPFYVVPGQRVAVRDRSATSSLSLRKPEHLPPAEIEAALVMLIDANFGARREELVVSAARLLGFAATSPQLRDVIVSCVQSAVSAGLIREDGDLLTRAGADTAKR
jgi:very-short-patch-repair endonuclease